MSKEIESIEQTLVDQIKSFLGKEDTIVLSLSALAALEGREKGDAEALKYSNIEELEDFLIARIAKFQREIQIETSTQLFYEEIKKIDKNIEETIKQNKAKEFQLSNIQKSFKKISQDFIKQNEINLDLFQSFYSNRLPYIEKFVKGYTGFFNSIKESFSSYEGIYESFQKTVLSVDEIEEIYSKFINAHTFAVEGYLNNLNEVIQSYDPNSLQSFHNIFREIKPLLSLRDFEALEEEVIKHIMPINAFSRLKLGYFFMELSKNVGRDAEEAYHYVALGIQMFFDSLIFNVQANISHNVDHVLLKLDSVTNKERETLRLSNLELEKTLSYLQGFLDAFR